MKPSTPRRTFPQWWHESGPGRLTVADWKDIGTVCLLGVALYFGLWVSTIL